MLSFKEFIVILEAYNANYDKERDQFFSKHLNVSRSKMPQVPAVNYKDFQSWLKSQGISFSIDSITPSFLHASQENIHYNKIETIINDTGTTKNTNPVLVSSDMFVLDGHHRVLAHRIMNKKIKIMKIDLSIKQLLSKMKEYPKVKFHNK